MNLRLTVNILNVLHHVVCDGISGVQKQSVISDLAKHTSCGYCRAARTDQGLSLSTEIDPS